MNLSPLVKQKFFDNNGNPLVGGQLFTYVAGTSTKLASYRDQAGTLNANPVVLDYRGEADVWLDQTLTYKFVVAPAGDTDPPTRPIMSVDNVSAAVTFASLTATIIGQILYPRTTQEIAAAVVPSNYGYPPGDLRRYGAIGNGSTDDNGPVGVAISTTHDIIVPNDYTFAISGNITGFANYQTVSGGGTFKKIGATVQPMFLLPDSSEGVCFDDVTLDGNRTLYSPGNAVTGVLGYLTKSFRTTQRTRFQNFIDAALKFRDGAFIQVEGSYFYFCAENAIEIRNYVNDPRTGSPYVGTRPLIEGGHQIVGARFERIGRIEDGGSGIVDGCAITFDSINGSYPIKGALVDGCTFTDFLRGVWSENNIAGSEIQDLVISNNVFRGNVYGTGSASYGKYGIGVIGTKGCVIEGNTLRNCSNYDAPASDRSDIIISAAAGTTVSEDVEILSNICIDDTGVAGRTEYAIRVLVATRLKISGNRCRGHILGEILIDASNTSEVSCYQNPGAEDEYSWGPVDEIGYVLENVAATTTVNMQIPGSTNQEYVASNYRRLVALGLRSSAAVAAGTISFTPKKNGVSFTALQITQADISSQRAVKKVAVSAGNQFAPTDVLTIEVVTNGAYTPTTNDFSVFAVFDTTVKR